MNKKQIIGTAVFIVVAIWANQTNDASLKPTLEGISYAGLIAILIDIFYWLITERAFWSLHLNRLSFGKEKEIRLTIAYLYKIEVNGKYLLVKSSRIPNTYQPVGGVYKYYDPEAKQDLQSMSAITDNHIANDNISERDLRLKLSDRTKIMTFLKWFFKAENRETDPWREFYEELIATNILPVKEFPYIHYTLIGQHFEPIHRDKFFNIDTFKYADIYCPKYVSHQQEEEVKKLLQKNDDDRYIWVTEQEIKRGKSNNHQLIADHTYKIFHTKILQK